MLSFNDLQLALEGAKIWMVTPDFNSEGEICSISITTETGTELIISNPANQHLVFEKESC